MPFISTEIGPALQIKETNENETKETNGKKSRSPQNIFLSSHSVFVNVVSFSVAILYINNDYAACTVEHDNYCSAIADEINVELEIWRYELMCAWQKCRNEFMDKNK